MPKRKHADTSPSSSTSLQCIRLSQKFDQSVAVLARALKTAKGFERQKLGRREKTAKGQGSEGANSGATMARLEGEIAVLKALDPTATAQKYLFKQLSKIKRIAESSAFAEFKELRKIPVEGPPSTEVSNVLGRLYKSNPVKNVLPGIMDGLRQVMGLDDTRSGGQKKDAASGKKDKKSDKGTGRGETAAGEHGADEMSLDEEADDDHDVANQSESGSESDLDLTQYDDQLASASDDSDNESDNERNDQPKTKQPAKPTRQHSMSITPSASASASASPSPSPSRSPSPPPKKQKQKQTQKQTDQQPPTSTTFLPSLSMGGYFSGGSDTEDSAPSDAAPKRKNRMGQQARRALWEKKYGAGANHVKKEVSREKRSRDSGWDLKRGATDGSEGVRGRRGVGGAGAGRGRGRGGHAGGGHGYGHGHGHGHGGHGGERGGAPKEKKKDDAGPLHPSWEAAKKAKEQKAASFQGKKVTFD